MEMQKMESDIRFKRFKKAAIIIGMFEAILILMSLVSGVWCYEDFTEDCDTIDTEIWQTSWTMPTATGSGQWLFSFNAYQSVVKQAELINMTSYGTYTVTMKMPPRVSGCNGWFFLYYKPGGSATWQELDFMEIWGSHVPSTAYDIALYVNGSQTKPGYGYGMGIGYWYPNVYSITGINFTDNQYHVWKYVYSDSDLIAYLDDVEFFKWSEDCINQTALGLPLPPMKLMVGGKGDGSQVKAWSTTVDQITYTTEEVEDPIEPPDDPSPSGPTSPPEPVTHAGGGSGSAVVILLVFALLLIRSRPNSGPIVRL